MYFETKINNIKHDGKNLWGTLDDIMGRKGNSTPSFTESEVLNVLQDMEQISIFLKQKIGNDDLNYVITPRNIITNTKHNSQK